jgi:hypothetical protein
MSPRWLPCHQLLLLLLRWVLWQHSQVLGLLACELLQTQQQHDCSWS